MYAQLIEGGTTPQKRAEMDRIVTEDMLPALARRARLRRRAEHRRPRERRRPDDHHVGDRGAGPAPARRLRRGVPEGAREHRRDLHRHAQPDLGVGGQRARA